MNTTTAISIASNALQLIGDSPISSFQDQGAGATVAKAFYETSYVALLAIHPWKFAKRKISLNQLTEKPLNSYDYAYQLPTDYIKVITTYPVLDYDIYQDKIYTNANKLDLDYVARVDESFLPPLYREALEFYLASKWAIPVTENATNAGVYANFFKDAMKKAKVDDGYGATGKSIRDAAAAPFNIRQGQDYRRYQ